MERDGIVNFGKFETASVLINVFIVKIFLGLPGELARSAGTAGWMVSLFSGLIFFGILFLIFKIYEGWEQNDIIELTEKSFGKPGKVVFSVILSVSFLVKGALALYVTSEIVVTVLPFDLPSGACIFLFILAALFCAWRGLEGVVRLHALFIPLILAAFLFSVFAAIKNAEITNIFPLFGLGYENIAVNSLKYIGIYSDIIYIFLLAPYVKNKKIYKKACLGGAAIAAVTITAVIFSYCLAVSYPMSTKLFMPIYQVSRLIKTAANSQGFEAFLLPEWIISSLLYISMSVYFASGILKKGVNAEHDKIFVLPAVIITYLLALVPKNLEQASFIGVKYINIFVIAVSLLAVLVVLIVKIKSRRKA